MLFTFLPYLYSALCAFVFCFAFYIFFSLYDLNNNNSSNSYNNGFKMVRVLSIVYSFHIEIFTCMMHPLYGCILNFGKLKC